MSFLGIDVGSSYIKLWHEDITGSVVTARNIHHKGSPQSVVINEVTCLNPEPMFLSFSGNLAGQDILGWHYEGLLAEIDYLRKVYPCRQLLIFGAEKIELVNFDESGHILFYQTNPSCAAGTGSFLDEQMLRLGLDFTDLPHITIDEKHRWWPQGVLFLRKPTLSIFSRMGILHIPYTTDSAKASC